MYTKRSAQRVTPSKEEKEVNMPKSNIRNSFLLISEMATALERGKHLIYKSSITPPRGFKSLESSLP